ncbi:MAG: FAD-dependent oxidoreductase [Saccharofermentanales bacterium]
MMDRDIRNSIIQYDTPEMHNIRDEYDVVVVGAGPAGLSSATSAKIAGARDVLIVERDRMPGGILPQCIHTGFGLLEYNEELTGPEYAGRWIAKARAAGVKILTGTIVLSIRDTEDVFHAGGDQNAAAAKTMKEIVISGVCTGIRTIRAKAVILAMGCRERTRGALGIPGRRPAGVITAGCAQRLVNVEGFMPGRRVVILGSGDIGLIMARRMTLEGARVVAVCEKMPKPGGLERNVQQCLKDFGIPLILNCTIIEIHGKDRVDSVTIARFDRDGKMIEGSSENIGCDTVMLSVGLIPENELSRSAGLKMDPRTGGPVAGADLQTSVPGIFACGNVFKVYDLVDNVSLDSVTIGKAAGAYVAGRDFKGSLRIEKEKKSADFEEPEDDDTKFIICTVCPRSCRIRAKREPGGEWAFDGYSCSRGTEYAIAEVSNPVRVLTSTVLMKIPGSDHPDSEGGTADRSIICGEFLTDERIYPVRTDRPIPLGKMSDAMAQIRRFVLDHVPDVGEIVITNIAGTDANIKVTGL